jgi:uncharacterized protein YcfL
MKFILILIPLLGLVACNSNTTSTAEDAAQELTVDEMLIRDSIRADSMKAVLLKISEEAEEIPAD